MEDNGIWSILFYRRSITKKGCFVEGRRPRGVGFENPLSHAAQTIPAGHGNSKNNKRGNCFVGFDE